MLLFCLSLPKCTVLFMGICRAPCTEGLGRMALSIYWKLNECQLVGQPQSGDLCTLPRSPWTVRNCNLGAAISGEEAGGGLLCSNPEAQSPDRQAGGLRMLWGMGRETVSSSAPSRRVAGEGQRGGRFLTWRLLGTGRRGRGVWWMHAFSPPLASSPVREKNLKQTRERNEGVEEDWRNRGRKGLFALGDRKARLSWLWKAGFPRTNQAPTIQDQLWKSLRIADSEGQYTGNFNS